MSQSTVILLGRYVKRSSVMHALDARCKLTLFFLFIIACLLATTPLTIALCTVFVVVAHVVAHISFRSACACVGPLLLVVIFTALANLFFVQGGATLWSIGPVSITENSLYQAVLMSVRLSVLLFGAGLITISTTPLAITNALESMLSPFTRLGLPAHELAMIAGIALRFVPAFASDFFNIRNAQLSRGATFSQGSFKERLHALRALLIPLFTGVFRHADTLAAAMDARCYHGGTGRTALYEQAFHARDAFACVVMLILLIAVILCKIAGK